MKSNAKKGFVILFTILISTIIMVIGLGIYSIATRESVLSGTSREAEYAFYAADAGVECALYAQSLDNASGQPIYIIPNTSSNQPVDCGTDQVTIYGTGTQYSFNVMVDTDKHTCAHVNIYDTTGTSGNSRRIISQGYNICDQNAAPATTNPILVERDLDTTYAMGGGTGSATSATTTGP